MKTRILIGTVMVLFCACTALLTWPKVAPVDSRITQQEAILRELTAKVPYNYLQAITVRVDVQGGCGTGVLVTRQVGDVRRTFVWTAGHVVKHLRNPDGSFRNPTIYQEWRDSGRYKCKTKVEAQVIAYSDPVTGEDLALLEVSKDNFAPACVSARFGDAKVGDEVVHVGCMVGLYDSVSLGIVSQTDRDLLGRMFDQTSCMGYPGSSGGGVYTKDGKCIGLMTLGVGPGLNFIVPTRRIVAWAEIMNIEWAVNPNVEVPVHWNTRDPNPLTDDPKSFINQILEAIR
jgi:S1-C subfamily serine protease